MTEKKNANPFAAMDPLTRAMLNIGDEPDGGELSGTPTQLPDALQRLDDLQLFGVTAPRDVPAPDAPVKKALTLSETKAALSAMADQVSDVRRRKIVEDVFPTMLASSEELYGETLTTRFLRAAVNKDKAAMRAVVAEMDKPFVLEPEPQEN
jgi:hypothetical protein